MVRWKTTVAIMAVLVSVLATACAGGDGGNQIATLGGGTDSTDTSAPSADKASFEDAMLDYARCMRDHGVDMPDPTFDGNGRSTLSATGEGGGPNPIDETFKAAQEACQSIMDAAEQNAPKPTPEEQAKMQDELLAFAQCMRDQGIDMPDPTFDEDGHAKLEIRGSGPDSDDTDSTENSSSSGDGPTTGGGPSDPKFQAASKVCQDKGLGGPGMVAGSSTGGDQ